MGKHKRYSIFALCRKQYTTGQQDHADSNGMEIIRKRAKTGRNKRGGQKGAGPKDPASGSYTTDEN